MTASSTSQYSSLLSSTLSSAPTSTPTSNGNTLDSGSLLLGFLISVLSLFGLFMISGLVWHRLVIRRRTIDEMLRVDIPSQKRHMRKPPLWDVWASLSRDHLQWSDTQPLATEKYDMPLPPPLDSQIPRPSFWKRQVIGRIPPEITYLFSPPTLAEVADPPLLNHSRVELPVDQSLLQVSFLIAMPRQPDSLSPSSKGMGLKKHRPLYEIVIGTSNVYYHDLDSQ
ncbi:uncharacterized protein BJ212DRAFT_1476302 [Suillus subaureus]|uniref:Uncharacterized protein n=1 Tax=Suillus subaureus TaxID=48587 RepID=A0A9P7EJP0_9AGAM|nr:uncharacterized protein BJ212DRAFT_1476302 [Suillus subaureus]KAG1823414.1 hypothetical protein BJ212DRAFT_1476302 [Suillus subaureus]